MCSRIPLFLIKKSNSVLLIEDSLDFMNLGQFLFGETIVYIYRTYLFFDTNSLPIEWEINCGIGYSSVINHIDLGIPNKGIVLIKGNNGTG